MKSGTRQLFLSNINDAPTKRVEEEDEPLALVVAQLDGGKLAVHDGIARKVGSCAANKSLRHCSAGAL